MSLDQGFVDLRLNQQEGQNQESFWPSFTDIMTVIVMIFMIALVVLLLRNIELVNQLRATMQAERSALELARSTSEEKESLALRLITTENQLSALRMRLMRMEERELQQTNTIGNQSARIARMKAESERLVLRQRQLEAEAMTLNHRLTTSETTIGTLRRDLSSTQSNLDSTRQQLKDTEYQLADAKAEIVNLSNLNQTARQRLVNLQAEYDSQSRNLQETKASEQVWAHRLDKLQTEYDDLQVEYNKLFKPARSPVGRYLVDVRYSKASGEAVLEYKTMEQSRFRQVSRKTLEQRLGELKAAKPEGLYIKVIFPENSGLEFGEAWAFTSELLGAYDYYHLEEQAASETEESPAD